MSRSKSQQERRAEGDELQSSNDDEGDLLLKKWFDRLPTRQKKLEIGNLLRNKGWDHLSHDFKKDHGLALAALQNGYATFGALPVEVQNDHAFLTQAVSQDCWIWRSLPEEIQNEISLVRTITKFTDAGALCSILEKFPELHNEKEIWWTIVNSSPDLDGHDIFYLVDKYAPPAILSDYEIMVKACALDRNILRGPVDGSLKRNRDFLRDVLTLKPEAFKAISAPSHRMFPDLVSDFLPQILREYKSYYSSPFYQCLAEQVALDLRENRDVIQAWFQGGGPFLPEFFMEDLKGDKQIFLWIAECSPKDQHGSSVVESFQQAWPTLLSDKNFMLQAIAHNPNVFHAAPEELRSDFDFQLLAFGRSLGKFPYIDFKTWPRVRRYITTFQLRVEALLQNHEFYVKTLLLFRCISQPSLPSLDEGAKLVIASYLDVPAGQCLRMLRQSPRNLASILSIVAQMPR